MPTDPRKLLADLRALSRHQPNPADTAAALAAARQALQQRRLNRQPNRHPWLRISIPSGIAACLLATALLFWFNQSSSRADASQQFRSAVQNAQAYQGWVQLVATPRGTLTVPNRGTLINITCRSNAADGLYGEVRQFQNDTEIIFCSLKQNTYEIYLRSAGDIHRRALVKDDDDDAPRDLLLPASLAGALSRVKSTLGRDPANLRHSHEGNETRIDVSLFKNHDEENEFRRKNNSRAQTPANFSLWVNPQNVITRLSCDSLGGTLDSTITYAAAPVTSIYDLGVPRTAAIVQGHSEDHGPDHPQDHDRH